MKRVLIIMLLLMIVFLASCSGKKGQNSESGQLHDYDSPYTICYKNEDNTYSMYIYAAPVQYKTDAGYALIDNTVVKSDKDGFSFENKANDVKTYFPKTLSEPFKVEKGIDFLAFKADWDVNDFSEAEQINFTNMYGDEVSAVIYKSIGIDLVFYPTRAGIKTEILIKEKPQNNEFVFKVNSNSSIFENKQNGYILFKNGGENKSIIYQPLVQYEADKGQQLDVTTHMNIKREEGDYLVTITINEGVINNAETQYPIKLDPSFEMYLNKMPDSTVYSKFNVNNYLCHYAVIGEHPILGKGWHYLRLRINYFATISPQNIISASYNIKSLSDFQSEQNINLFLMDEQWSSGQMVWNNKIKHGKLVLNKPINGANEYELDITEYVRQCASDITSITESQGLVVSGENIGNYNVFATSDNSLYTPYIKIDIKILPSFFDPEDNINGSANY